MRTLSAAAASELARQHGSAPLRVLAMSWSGITTVLYSESSTSIVADGGGSLAIAGRVREWPSLTWGGDDASKIAAAADVSVTLDDSDGAISALLVDAVASAAGVYRVRAGLYLFWRSHLGPSPLTWPADRVELFDGCVESFERSIGERTVTLHLTSWHLRYPALLGVRVTRTAFPESPREGDGNGIIPLVFGESVRRVPAVLIDRPGTAYLGASCRWYEDTLRINQDADVAGFPLNVTITITVGVPGNTESMTGRFLAADKTLFVIASRSGQYAAGAESYDRGAFCYPVSGIDRVFLPIKDSRGLPIMRFGYLSKNGHMGAVRVGGVWFETLVTDWGFAGVGSAFGRYVKAFPRLGVMNNSGLIYYQWAVCYWPGQSPTWPAGCQVMQSSPLVLAVNSEPSLSVDRVEFRQRVNGNGNQPPCYYTLREDQYTLNLDNRDFNAAIGRDPVIVGVSDGEPGITTISLLINPAEIGMESAAYVTLSGVVDPDSVAANPVNPENWTALNGLFGLAKWLLTNDHAAGLDLAQVDLSAILAAHLAVAARQSAGQLAFAVREPLSVWDVLEQVAAQSTCRVRIDGGVVAIDAVSDFDAVPVATCAVANSVAFESRDTLTTDLPLRVIADVPRYVGDDWPSRIAGVINNAPPYCEEQQWNWPAYQNISQAVKPHVWWQRWQSERQRITTTTRYLDSLAVTPSDAVGITITDASASAAVIEQVELSADRPATVELTGPHRVEAVELDAVLAPAGVVLSTFDRDTGGNRESVPNTGGWRPGREYDTPARYAEFVANQPQPVPIDGFEEYGVPPSVTLTGTDATLPITLNGYELWYQDPVEGEPYVYGFYHSEDPYNRYNGWHVTLFFIPSHDFGDDRGVRLNVLKITVEQWGGGASVAGWALPWPGDPLLYGIADYTGSPTEFDLRNPATGVSDLHIEFISDPPRFWWQHPSVWPSVPLPTHCRLVRPSDNTILADYTYFANPPSGAATGTTISGLIAYDGNGPYVYNEARGFGFALLVSKSWQPTYSVAASEYGGFPEMLWGQSGPHAFNAFFALPRSHLLDLFPTWSGSPELFANPPSQEFHRLEFDG